MPITQEWQSRLLTLRFKGDVTPSQLLNTINSLSGDSRFDDLRHILCDWTQTEELPLDIGGVEVLVAHIEALALHNPRIRLAMARSPNETNNALGSLFLMLTERLPWEVNNLPTAEESLQWLRSKDAAEAF